MKNLCKIIPFILVTGLLMSCGKESAAEQNTAEQNTAEPQVIEDAVDGTLAKPTEDTEAGTGEEQVEDTVSGPIDENFATEHGALRVEGSKLVDQNGEPIQLYGMSTHGIAWFPAFVNKDAFQTLRDDWHTNCVRLAMYTHENGGYCVGGDKETLKSLICTGVEAATELGMYCIIDWHVLNEQNPNVYQEESKAFFSEMSEKYANHTNIIYEICNEPNGSTSWEDVKSYAKEIIPVIRANDPDAVIIVGTTNWSQDINKALALPLEEENILYALHFYAGTHKDELRSRMERCIQGGLPVIVSEFGMCDASGNGANDFESAKKWMDLIEKHNVSFFCWNLANKNEASSVFKASCMKTADWTEEDMNESGKWIRNYFRSK